MAFFKFRTRGPQGNEGRNTSVAAAPAESIEAMRRRARHRLVGAAVLVLVGVIGFPLLFDTQPRPVAVDIPIEIPDRHKTPPLVPPASPAAPPSTGGMITEAPDGTEIAPAPPPDTQVAAAPPPAPAPAPAPEPEAKPPPEPRPEPKPQPEAQAKPADKPAPAAPKPADDGARARALLEGKPATVAAATTRPPAAAAETGRFVVQVGAFADASKAREVRQQLEKAGLKTYTQVAKTSEGERTRVRVGPFGTRAEAERTASRIKGLSLPAAVLTL